MNYDVVVADRAAEELESAARWWAEHRSLNQAERWYDGFIQAILTLDQAPDRYPLARENHKFPFEIRQFVFGIGRKRTHRAVFTIRQDTVVVLSIRHLRKGTSILTICRDQLSAPMLVSAQASRYNSTVMSLGEVDLLCTHPYLNDTPCNYPNIRSGWATDSPTRAAHNLRP